MCSLVRPDCLDARADRSLTPYDGNNDGERRWYMTSCGHILCDDPIHKRQLRIARKLTSRPPEHMHALWPTWRDLPPAR